MVFRFNTKIVGNKASMQEAQEVADAIKSKTNHPVSIKETKKGRFIVFEKYR